MHSRCINDLPPEIISEILLHAIDSFGDDIFLKWGFPLIFRGVSKRFHRIIDNTCSLWRYLYVGIPRFHDLSLHISRSGSLPLEADIAFDEEIVEEDEVWKNMVDTLVPIFPRLVSLAFRSPLRDRQIVEILRHKMPILSFLEIEGPGGGWDGADLHSNCLPALRRLRSSGAFQYTRVANIPETLEELYISNNLNIGSPGRFWNTLPSKLRVLEMKNVPLNGITASQNAKVHLPCLTNLRLLERATTEELSVLQCLDAPCLQTLEVDMDYASTRSRPFPWCWVLDFPALTHFEWQSGPNVPRFADLLRRCINLRVVYIKTRRYVDGVSCFVFTLARDKTLLPLLEDLLVFGTSLCTLKEVIQARPGFKRLQIHKSDLTPAASGVLKKHTGLYEEWALWLESHVDLRVNDTPSPFYR